ncbi:hypothetical protein WJX72_004642 [[Myrmecia] bisecta]|uniref:Uncharacterized protein n=1 Tax=[Myrmecia] bisecta TaxID=41462 RepID=A0AAW1Q798_9CHLO
MATSTGHQPAAPACARDSGMPAPQMHQPTLPAQPSVTMSSSSGRRPDVSLRFRGAPVFGGRSTGGVAVGASGSGTPVTATLQRSAPLASEQPIEQPTPAAGAALLLLSGGSAAAPQGDQRIVNLTAVEGRLQLPEPFGDYIVEPEVGQINMQDCRTWLRKRSAKYSNQLREM